ncbi:MAG: HupE/UreJ family protein [Rhodospirillaceae bacterium]|nr:HupE/UreJ family protein [Rhodospirillaceae bacterium]
MPFLPRHLPLLAGALLLTLAAPAEAHPGHAFGGWTAGFSHPLLGWDHFVVMVAVGAWAAQHAGAARWIIPATFVAVMGSGGVAGALGLPLPGVEAMILLSVITLAGLVLARRNLPLGWGMAVTGLFAFFHGFAHGQEISDTSRLMSFGAGFMAATAFLHGLGYAGAAIATRRKLKHI